MNYTKGEWHITEEFMIRKYIYDSDGRLVATVNADRPEYLANAQLIASAPLLYEALNGALWVLKGGNYGRVGKPDQARPKAIEQAEKALTKAEGK